MTFQGSITGPGRALYQDFVASIIVSQQQTDIELLATELHELCHAHQSWYSFKEYVDYGYLKRSWHRGPTSLWYETPMAQEFNEVVGFKQNEDGNWKLRSGHPYARVYGISDPLELSAELCAYYLLQEIQPNSQYKQYAQDPYITPEIQQWIETYIVLPEPEGAAVAGG